MAWNRDMLEESLQTAYDNAGQTANFTLVVPEGDMAAVLLQLNHLKAAGRMTSFSRREPQEQSGRDDCVNIYGYVPLA